MPIAVAEQAGVCSHSGTLYTSYDFVLAFGHPVRTVAPGVIVEIRETVPDDSASALPNPDGGGGNDTLNGGAGNDTLNGGIGADTLLAAGWGELWGKL